MSNENSIASWFGSSEPIDNTVPIEESKDVIVVPIMEPLPSS